MNIGRNNVDMIGTYCGAGPMALIAMAYHERERVELIV